MWHRDVLNSWRRPRDLARYGREEGNPPGQRRRSSWSIALLTLTSTWSIEAAYGRASQFWKRQRDRYGELTYFCWLEVTAAGNPHYHALVVNPPRNFFSKANQRRMEQDWNKRWVSRDHRDGRWFERNAAGYLRKYSEKMADKAYEQNYEEIPRQLRTFMSNRVAHDRALLLEHIDHWESKYVSEKYTPIRGVLDPPHVELTARIRHVGSPCSIPHVTKSQDLAKRKRRSERSLFERLQSAARAAEFRKRATTYMSRKRTQDDQPLEVHSGTRDECPACAHLGIEIPKLEALDPPDWPHVASNESSPTTCRTPGASRWNAAAPGVRIGVATLPPQPNES